MGTADIIRAVLACVVGSTCAGCATRGLGVTCPACALTLRDAPPVHGDTVFADVGVPGRMVRLGKAGHWRSAGDVLARHAAARIRSGHIVVPSFDAITWVPADPRRRAQRGGHLPERFARGLANSFEVPCGPVLVRRGGTAQRGLDRRARAHNLDGAFGLLTRSRLLHASTALLLVDDVRTTGATFEAARRALQPHVASVAQLAIVGVDLRSARPGARPQKPAPSAENPLTSQGKGADGVWKFERKVDDR